LKPKTKFLNKTLGALLVFATLIITFFTFSILVQASSLVSDDQTGYYYTGVPVYLGHTQNRHLEQIKRLTAVSLILISG
jgi:hypothetical protein